MPSGIYIKNPITEKLRREKISNSLKFQWKNGKVALRPKGFKMSEEQKKKIGFANSISLKGKKLSIETINKRTNTRKGYRHSSETKNKIGCANAISLKGKKLSQKTKEKISESLKGEKSYLWKGGITPTNLKIRNGLEYRLWRKSCFERDNFTCQRCKINGGRLIVHHINNFADFIELRFAIDNGITLCENCHKKFHKEYGFRNNTKKQLLGYLPS